MSGLRRMIRIAVVASIFAFSIVASSQVSNHVYAHTMADESPLITDDDIERIRLDIRFREKQILAANMKLTATEAEKFWPVYDQYVSELDQIDDARYALMKQDIQKGGLLSDVDAEYSVKQWAEVDQSLAQLRMKYIPYFRQVLPSKKTALFCQLERHVEMMVDVQLESSLPIIQP